jgi:HTH-type transcriptional regulator / antitoxin HigA
MIAVIKNESDYKTALAALEKLIALDPAPESPDAEKLDLLTLLVQAYESKYWPIEKPDPIEAIKFRMEQEDLSQRDLIPYIGSRSKVSEILSRKRPLTLSMIRALHQGLGIPADVLVQETDELPDLVWTRFPLREMIRRNWIPQPKEDIRDGAEQILRDFFAPLKRTRSAAALYRKTDHIRSGRTVDRYALTAWTARVLLKAMSGGQNTSYTHGAIDLEFMREVARLSWSERGPLLAREFLKNHGIALVIEPHLPKTFLDGAAIIGVDQRPVIALTIRYDRVDNFWFSLMHELAHVALHLEVCGESFYDDLDVEEQDDRLEVEADEFAGEALIPEEKWDSSPAKHLRSPEAAEHLAKELSIHPAIVAGRMRHYFKAYRLLNKLIGHGQVRRLFPEEKWK